MPTPSPTTPNDSNITHPALRFLTTPDSLPLRQQALQLATNPNPPSAADVTRLRKSYPAEFVHAALTLATTHLKATNPKGKFPLRPGVSTPNSREPIADSFFLSPPEALEQSTSLAVARHKATRFAAAWGRGARIILDLCAGIGGDSLGLAHAAPVLALELSPLRAFCLQHNTKLFPAPHAILPIQADIQQLPINPHSNTVFHLDPARRSSGHRTFHYKDLIPGPTTIAAIFNNFPNGALKLSPAVDFSSLPPGHLELISERNTVVHAILWTGTLAATLGSNSKRTATIITRAGQPWSFTATPATPTALATPNQFLYELDPVLTRSSLATPLLDQLQLTALTPDAGYATHPQQTPLQPLDHPALTPFQILQTLPYSERQVTQALSALAPSPSHPASPPTVEVKTRGGLALDPDHLQKQWNPLPPFPVTVLIYKAHQTVAVIARRIPRTPASIS